MMSRPRESVNRPPVLSCPWRIPFHTSERSWRSSSSRLLHGTADISLTPGQTASMAATGAVSSFASPLVTMPYLLDQYHLPQDLMALFILPGFITMRLGDVVGVMHLMALTLIVTRAMQRQLRIRWPRLVIATVGLLVCLVVAGAASRWYLASTTLALRP